MDTRLSVTTQTTPRAAAAQPTPGKSLSVEGNSLPQLSPLATASSQAERAEKSREAKDASTAGVVARALAKDVQQESNEEQVEKVVAQLNDFLKDVQRDLQFSIDRDTGRTILKVIHSESGEVIRQIPPEELLNLAKAFAEGTGSLIQDRA